MKREKLQERLSEHLFRELKSAPKKIKRPNRIYCLGLIHPKLRVTTRE